jgi:hypothetical protein
LPFFGAEAFSLPIIAAAAQQQHSQQLLDLINAVRFGPGLGFILIGLILLSISSLMLARVVWVTDTLPKWSGIILAMGILLFLPTLQGAPFFQLLRILDGLIILSGASWLAKELLRYE